MRTESERIDFREYESFENRLNSGSEIKNELLLYQSK